MDGAHVVVICREMESMDPCLEPEGSILVVSLPALSHSKTFQLQSLHFTTTDSTKTQNFQNHVRRTDWSLLESLQDLPTGPSRWKRMAPTSRSPRKPGKETAERQTKSGNHGNPAHGFVFFLDCTKCSMVFHP